MRKIRNSNIPTDSKFLLISIYLQQFLKLIFIDTYRNKLKLIAIILLVSILHLGVSISFAQVSTDPNFKVAFIGDAGSGNNATNVLNLIKSEGAQAMVHQGDFDYSFNATAFWGKIDSVLGSNFPYFVSVGNHDAASWNEGCGDADGCYAKFQKDRLARIGVVPDSPDLNDQLYSATFKGLKMVFIGLAGNSAGASVYSPYIQSQLQSDSHTWKVCSWHKNQTNMQLGTKADEMGWNVYEMCRQQGAIIATGHEHTYERTKTLTNIQGLTVDTTQHPLVGGVPGNQNSLLVAPGKTFVFVSGLGGNGPRNQDRCIPFTYPYGGGVGCNYIWASVYTTDQGGSSPFGALFITFNVDGNPNKARGYFKTVAGQVVDQFEIAKSSTPVTGQPTPTPTPQGPTATPIRTPTPGGPTVTRTPTPGGPTATRTPTPGTGTPTPTPKPGMCTYWKN